MNQEPMILTAIYLPEDLRQAAKEAAKSDGYGSMAEVVRQAMIFFFASKVSASKHDTSKQVVREPA